MSKEINPDEVERPPANRLRRGIGTVALGAVLATAGVIFIHEIEKPEPAGEAKITAVQQAILDKTAADTATRLLKGRLIFGKQVHTHNGSTTISAEQSIQNSKRFASLSFTFEGMSSGTDVASAEEFLRSQHPPHVEHIKISKNGNFILDVKNYATDQLEVDVKMPDIVLHPHNDALPMSDFTPFQRGLAIANGMYGADSPGGIPKHDRGRILPSDVPSLTASHN